MNTLQVVGLGFRLSRSPGPLFLEHQAHQPGAHHPQGDEIAVAQPPGEPAGPGGGLPAAAAAPQAGQDQQGEAAENEIMLQPQGFQGVSAVGAIGKFKAA
jgi:hypothetical protein